MNEVREKFPYEPEISDSTKKWIATFIEAIYNIKSPENEEVNSVLRKFRDEGYDREVYGKILHEILPPA